MEEKESPSIDRIIEMWKAKYGEKWKESDFLVIPIPNRRSLMLNLIQAMAKFGHTEENVRSGVTSTKVVKTCWSDLIKKLSNKELRKNRDIARNQWESAVDEFYMQDFDFPEYKKKEKPKKEEVKEQKRPELKKEPILDLDPKDRIKMDTSDMIDNPLDLDFLSELGIDESFMNGRRDE